MHYRLTCAITFLAHAVVFSQCARILMLSPMGTRSHMYSFMPILEVLAERSHQVTVVTAHEPKTDTPNIRKIVISEIVEHLESGWQSFERDSIVTEFLNFVDEVSTLGTIGYQYLMANKDIHEIIQNKDVDLVIVDAILNEFTLPLVDHLGVPFIFHSASTGPPWSLAVFDVPNAYATVPSLGFRMLDDLARPDFPNARPIAEIERSAQLCLASHHSTTAWPRSLPPTFIPIGALHVRPAKPLPNDFQSFADGAEHGFIVFTLGSNALVSDMPESVKEMFIRVFARIPQRVFWKWEAGTSDANQISSNVKMVDWLPQQDLSATCMAARILVLSPLGPRSHMHSFMPMVETLAEKGHQLTVVTPYAPETEAPNIRKITTSEMVELVELEWYDFKEHSLLDTMVDFSPFVQSIMTTAYKRFMANKEIQEITQKKNYDIAIVDAIINDFCFPLVDHLGIPLILFDPGPGTIWNLEAKGVTRDYARIPPLIGTFSSQMTFFERVQNVVLNEGFLLFRKWYLLPVLDRLAKLDFPTARPISEIERNAEICFANIHPASSWTRSLPPTFIPVGAMHVRPAMPLPQDLQEFADAAERGLIVFTLGSNSRVSSMPVLIQETFLRVFSRLPQRIIWKWEKDGLSQIPDNVRLVDWLPQQDLLGHKNTRLFIAHGGIMGIQEAIYHKVPILGLPLGRDQYALLIRSSEEGYAIKLEWENLNEELLYESIQKLLHQPSYKGNVTRMSSLMHNELVPSREVAAYWVEHVLLHGGTKHFSYFDESVVDIQRRADIGAGTCLFQKPQNFFHADRGSASRERSSGNSGNTICTRLG